MERNAKQETITPVITVERISGPSREIKVIMPEDMRVRAGRITTAEEAFGALFDGSLDLTTTIKQKREISALKTRTRELESLVQEGLTFAELRERITGIAEAPVNMPDWTFDYQNAPGFPGVPIAVLSDLHYGEVVGLDQMGGSNQYNIEIADERIKTWTKGLIDLCFEHETWKGKYPGLVLCLGGDMISGDIHEELKESNDLPTSLALLRLSGTLKRSIKELADHFGHVMVPCVTGNHGRMGHKPQAKGYNEVNYETMLYLLLEREFQDDPRVKFVFPNETVVHFKVNHTNYALTHGNLMGVKGGDGIIGAIGPIRRGTVKLGHSEASKPRPQRIDYVIMGHWHTAMRLPGAFVNGSLKGYDEYAQDFLRTQFERPGQILWRDHPKHGPVRFEVIYADEDMQRIQKPRPKATWFTTEDRYSGQWNRARISAPAPSAAPSTKRAVGKKVRVSPPTRPKRAANSNGPAARQRKVG